MSRWQRIPEDAAVLQVCPVAAIDRVSCMPDQPVWCTMATRLRTAAAFAATSAPFTLRRFAQQAVSACAPACWWGVGGGGSGRVPLVATRLLRAAAAFGATSAPSTLPGLPHAQMITR